MGGGLLRSRKHITDWAEPGLAADGSRRRSLQDVPADVRIDSA